MGDQRTPQLVICPKLSIRYIRMSDDQTVQNNDPNEPTSAGRTTSSRRPPRELPRRGYENQPRPMNPPPPTPLTTEQPRQRPVSRLSEQSRRAPAAPPPPTATPATPRRGRSPRPSKGDSGLYLPWWSLLVLILVAGVISFGLLAAALNSGGTPPGDQPGQVVIVTNENEPTLQPVFDTNSGEFPDNVLIVTFTPGGVPTNQVVAPTQVPNAEPTETPLPGVSSGCPLNALVSVTGTGEVGLSLRSEPRQGENIVAVIRDGEQFRIIAGPETSTSTVDGSILEWCQIEGVDVPSRNGWAARQFLAEITVE